MESQEEQTNAMPTTTPTVAPTAKYSNRVLLKTILKDGDGGLGLVGNRVIIGGWVKSSREVNKQLPPPISTEDHGAAVDFGHKDKDGDKDVSCVEILQSRIPFFRTIVKVLSGGRSGNYTIREKPEVVIPSLPPPSIVYLQVNDGSCLGNLQVVVDSAIAAPSSLLPIGTCILVEGVLQVPSVYGKHDVELKTEKILHIGTVDHDNYPLSKKRIHLDTLRDYAHIRPRTSTVASVMRIRSALTFATHTFFQNNGFLYVETPVITSTDCEGFSEKFQVTTLLEKADKEEQTPANIEGVTLDTIKAAIREKSNLVEELKRSDSNKEALVASLQDLQKTNEIAAQLEAREKEKQPSVKTDKIDFSEDFFSRQTYLTVSGRLHLESYACAVGYVYSLGPRFRAEKMESAKRAAEMWTAEIEMAFSQLEDAMNCAEDYFKSLCKWMVENCSQDLNFVSKRIDKTISERLQSIISNPFEKITYTYAVKVLGEVTDKIFETKLEWGVTLTAEHLSYLADVMYKRPVLIYDYPKAAKPFYVRLNDDGYTVAAFDMVVPKVGTLITGSQNEERLDMLSTRIKDLGLPSEQYEWYLDLRRHGTVKHSGFSLGIDLMVLFTTGLTDVRDAIPFPRSLGKANN